MMNEKIEIAIIGGGVIGTAVAYELSESFDNVFLFERRPFLCNGASGRNSGVIHSGIYYRSGSMKARLCPVGNRMLYELCQRLDIPCRRTGKIIVATESRQEATMEELYENGIANGVPGLAILSGRQVTETEPAVTALCGLHCPTTGILDAASLVMRLAAAAAARGVQILTETKVTAVQPTQRGFFIQTDSKGGIEASFIINATGVYSDELAKMVNPANDWRIVPVRGEYFELVGAGAHLVRRNIYPVPGKQSLGIHLTPTFEEKLIVGPNAKEVADKEDYTRERALPEQFAAAVAPFCNAVRAADLKPGFAGIRARLADGDDFVIEQDSRYPRCIHLVGIDSPGLTCCLPIAAEVHRLMIDV